MNTIPSIFDEHQINRTVLGGRVENKKATLNMSVILLNTNGSYFKSTIFENLLDCNFRSIVAVEMNSKNSSIEDFSKQYPSIKFIIPLEETTDGEMINLAMAEIESDYVMVIRNTLMIHQGFIQPFLEERILEERIIKEDLFCMVPRLTDNHQKSLMCHFVPGASKNNFVVQNSISVSDGMCTLYPYDNIAIYNRNKFIKLGGFDYSIKSKYWQNLDFGIRSWLWGEKTKLTTLLQFSYIDELPVDDKTVNLDYLRYFLKNELPKIKNDRALISNFAFFKFYISSSCGILEARRQFREAKDWVYKNKLKFKMDLPELVKEWK